MAIQDVTLVSVPVSDQDRAKAFYLEALGFELIEDAPSRFPLDPGRSQGGQRVARSRGLGRMDAGLVPRRTRAHVDLQAACEELVAKDVEFDAPPQPSRTRAGKGPPPFGRNGLVHKQV
jgi:catechol 2,3-dioxygenase-like lactoylglutathione lyase family enzyme